MESVRGKLQELSKPRYSIGNFKVSVRLTRTMPRVIADGSRYTEAADLCQVLDRPIRHYFSSRTHY